ncbi:modifier of mdg4-like [Anopheles marshallii]|uniref:modifier of mdg4-like n=1 Tax=Anopheles marshallii TaxID=1521116 RepID=UPI00237C13CE|nr:modifier of mdg4-like [Anopheles marshallii]
MANSQSLSLRWNDYSSYIAGAFESLRYEEDLVDVTLYCEGRKIRAHKMLLSACSSYFKNVFKENPSQHPIIIFKNVKYSDLQSLIEFMYKGEVHVLQESLPSFLQTANILSVRGLSEPFFDEQNLSTTAQDLPRSMLAQKILQTQSQNMNSATITTDEVYYALATPESTFSPQIKTEVQPTISQQFISKVVLKPTNDLTVPNDLGNSIIPQVQPQQQTNSTANVLHPSTAALQTPTKRGKQHYRQTNESKPVILPVDELIIAQGSTSQPDESKQSLQELVNSVLPSPRQLRTARILKQNVATSKETETTKTTSPTIPETPTNRSEIYNATTAQSQDISEFINVGESLVATCGDGSAYTQPDEFEMVCENITHRSESEEPMEQSTGFEMQIVDIGVDNTFLDEEEKAAVTHTATDDTENTQKKQYKCNSCDKSFVTWKSLTMHSHIHSGRTKCNICGAVLSRTANLKRHMKLKHEP